ncbi:hypothetical protein MJH12_02550, partial [bacterium]|nr:hypothetical protein [bacterium]
ELQKLSIVNTGSADKGNLVIREKDSLEIIQDGKSNGGLYTSSGSIDLELSGKESFLNLSSGVISTANSGKYILLVADDINFASGANKVSGSGKFTIHTKSSDQTYRIGGAGNSKFGNDFSAGTKNGALNFSMVDFSALTTGFSLITIGQASDTVLMTIGDIEDISEYGNTFSAKLNDDALFIAKRINVAGDIQSSKKATFNARLFDIKKQNINDTLGSPDSGVTANQVFVVAEEQMLLSGWIRATEKIDIDVTNSTGNNAIVTFGSEANSFRADQGSVLVTLGNNASINIDTSASIISATGIEVFGHTSTIVANAGTSIKILEGAVVAARTDNSSIHLNATTYLHIDSGGAVTAGARFEDDNGNPVAIKTGENASLTLKSTKEMRLSGAITSSGEMTLDGGGADSDYASYFDTIPGKVLAEKSLDQSILDALNSGNINSSLRALFDSQNITLASSPGVNSISNYTPFSSLSEDQQKIIADSLGYTIYKGTNFYNADASGSEKLVSNFTQGALPYVASGSSMSALGYTQYGSTAFYNPLTNQVATSFVQGAAVDYDNALINWGSAGTPSSSVGFDSLSAAQKTKVAEYLGYQTDDGV